MFERLQRFQERELQRGAGGLTISVLFHVALLGALLSATERVRGGASAPEPSRRAPATVAGVEGSQPGVEGEEELVREAAGEPAPIAVSLPPLTLPDEVLAAARLPRLVPRLPDTLELGRAHTLRLALPRNRLPEDSVVMLPDPAVGISRVRIARAWQATLYGPDLVVEPRRPPMQLTDSLRPTEWQWTITPTQPGTRTVYLQIDAPAEINGQPAVVTLQRVQQQVYIQATLLQRVSRFFSRHWTWLSLLGIAAGLGWARARFGFKPAPPPSQTPSRPPHTP